MAADGVAGTKGNPQFLGSGAPATAADSNIISTWAADNIDRRVADKAARDAIVLKYVGMVVQTASDNNIWLCTNASGSGTWIPIGTPIFADMAALTAGIPATPDQGTKAKLLTDPGYDWVWLNLYNVTTNKPGANPAGWYPENGATIAQATRYNAADVSVPNSATTIPTLSAIGVAPGTPVSLLLELFIKNAASGAHRTIDFQFFEDATGLGTARQFGFANDVGYKAVVIPYTYTPTAGIKTWTAKFTASAAAAVQYTDAKLTVLAATPRS